MSLWSIITGVDLEEDQRRGDAADAGNQKLNRELLDRGVWDKNTYDDSQKNFSKSTIDANREVADAFEEGLDDGYRNVTGTIKTVLAAPFNFAFSSIPWQLWLLGLGALAYYMGGATWLKGRFAK